VNCAAIPEALVENELFGHEKGAFTGADSRRAGKFELAHGGTIFLDEIGELPLPAQGKLLRVLEERTIERLGGSGSIQADVRVIAATNRDLEAAADDGEYRKDLFYRLNVFPIHIPSLRDRGDDVLLLAEAFLERFKRERNRSELKLDESARTAIVAYDWPGNVRELQNLIERASIIADKTISAEHLALRSGKREGPQAQAQERQQIESVLRQCKWNKTRAAERLGISYKSLLSKIHAYGLD
jgi:transcriptional regulator with GAF, ATPase, and Fis domain